MNPLRAAALASLCLLSACSSSLSGPALRDRLHDHGLRVRTADLEASAARQPSFDLPLRLAIGPPWNVETGPWLGGSGVGTWSAEERAHFGAWIERAKQSGLVESVEFIPSLLVESPDEDGDLLRSMRAAAALQHCDAVLVTQRTLDTARWEDEWSVFYLTIVGMFFVPATHVESMAIVEGFVLDVETGALWRSADGTMTRDAKTNFIRADREQRRLPEQAALTALDAFCEALLRSVAAHPAVNPQ